MRRRRFLMGSASVSGHVSVPGRDLFSTPAAAYLLTLIEGGETWAKNLTIRPEAEAFARAVKNFADARERYVRASTSEECDEAKTFPDGFRLGGGRSAASCRQRQ